LIVRGRVNRFIASEGLPYLAVTAVLTLLAWFYAGWIATAIGVGLFVWLFLIFHDPVRRVPAAPLGVVSPVDGKVVEIGAIDQSVFGREAQFVAVAVNSLGTYTARGPIEGKIMDLATADESSRAAMGSGGLWIRTDEDDDVVLRFRGNRFGLAPKCLKRYGERVGQGQRCAFLRLTRIAEVQVPPTARIKVEVGQPVSAGADILAELASD